MWNDASSDGMANLQGAAISFAINSYFAKNDNLSDILGVEDTVVGDFVDFSASFTASYYASNYVSNITGIGSSGGASATNGANAGSAGGGTNFASAFQGAVAAYAGSYLANEVGDWDTKDEAIALGNEYANYKNKITLILDANGVPIEDNEVYIYSKKYQLSNQVNNIEYKSERVA